MTAETTIDRDELRELIADVLDIDPAAVTPEANFVTDLGVDSLLALELAVALERHYGLRVESSDMLELLCLRDVAELLDRKVRAT